MAKRKSSKTTAQSDPTKSEDIKKDVVDADAIETSDQSMKSDTASSGDGVEDKLSGSPTEVETIAPVSTEDTAVALDATDTVIAEDAVASVTTDSADDTVKLEVGEDSVAPLDADDSVTALSGDDSIVPAGWDEGVATLESDTATITAETDVSVATLSSDDTVTLLDDDTVKKDDDGNEIDGEKSERSFGDSEPDVLAPPPATNTESEPQLKPRTIMPMIIGGFIAALLGFVAARTEVLDGIFPSSDRAEAPVAAPPPPPFDDSALTSGLEALTTRMTELEATVAALPSPQEGASAAPAPEVDLSAIESEIAALSAKVDDVANQPPVEAPVPTDALDAALAELRAKASEQQAEIDKLLADQQSTIKDAETAAKATLARTAMTGIQSAINAGSPFDAPLGELGKTGLVDVPQDLNAAAADGVASLASLQETFPDAARAALYAARDAETGNGLGGFLQLQLGTRAIEPREGSDPDAVLSRIEAATRTGDLDTVLAEAQTLPEPAQDAMSAWIEKAQSRHNAVMSANALAERLSAL